MVVLLKGKTLEHLATKERAVLSKIRLCNHNPAQTKIAKKSDKANAAKSNTEREKKQTEGCEKDPKSMEESEEKPPEGCKKQKTSQASDS